LALGYFCADLNYVLFMKRFKEPRGDEGQVEYFIGGSLSTGRRGRSRRSSASCRPT
jgi:hypothetical protein